MHHKNIGLFGRVNVFLSPREFYDTYDFVGLLQHEPEESSYLSLESLIYESGFQDDVTESLLTIQLADVHRVNSREVYSFFSLLSDFGGFTGAITLLPAIIMSMYNSRKFAAALFTVFPFKHKSRSDHQDRLKAKFKADPPTGKALEDEDI